MKKIILLLLIQITSANAADLYDTCDPYSGSDYEQLLGRLNADDLKEYNSSKSFYFDPTMDAVELSNDTSFYFTRSNDRTNGCWVRSNNSTPFAPAGKKFRFKGPRIIKSVQIMLANAVSQTRISFNLSVNGHPATMECTYNDGGMTAAQRLVKILRNMQIQACQSSPPVQTSREGVATPTFRAVVPAVGGPNAAVAE
jgi:hypothetical protein